MTIQKPFNLLSWIEENKHLLKPPVNNKVIYKDSDFMVMVVGGPNSRKDYHYNEGEELFYQIQGNITVKIQENGKSVNVDIKEGDIFLLPPKVPHSPVRTENSIGLVIERKRHSEELDGLLWFCEKCNHKLFEKYFVLTSIEKDFLPVFKYFYTNLDLRTCKKCGHVMDADSRYI